MLTKFKGCIKSLFTKEKAIPEAVPVQEKPAEPKPKQDFFKKLVTFYKPEEKRKKKHRKRGDRHGLSLRDTRKMGVAA